jgi:hypothetical protein
MRRDYRAPNKRGSQRRKQRAKLKSRRDDLTIAQGKSRSAGNAALGQNAQKNISLSPSDGERGEGFLDHRTSNRLHLEHADDEPAAFGFGAVVRG